MFTTHESSVEKSSWYKGWAQKLKGVNSCGKYPWLLIDVYYTRIVRLVELLVQRLSEIVWKEPCRAWLGMCNPIPLCKPSVKRLEPAPADAPPLHIGRIYWYVGRIYARESRCHPTGWERNLLARGWGEERRDLPQTDRRVAPVFRVSGLWFMGYGLWFMVGGLWFRV